MFKYYYKNDLGEVIDFSPLGGIIALNVQGINGHQVDVISAKGLGQIGSSVTDLVINSKDITINGVIRGNLQLNRKKIIDIIRPQATGYLYTINENGEEFKIKVFNKKTPTIGFGASVQNFQLTFLAEYPYWTKAGGNVKDIRGLEARFRLPKSPLGVWKFSEAIRSEFINVFNEGNEKIGIKIELRARTLAVNPTIENVTTGKKIKLNYTMKAQEVITITTGYNNKRVTSSMEGNIFRSLDLLNSTFFQLEKGDNIFKFSAEENEQNVDVRIYYEEVLTSI